MRALWGTMSPQAEMRLRLCAWAVLTLAILASLPFLFHVLNRGIDWITDFPLVRERWLEGLLWTR